MKQRILIKSACDMSYVIMLLNTTYHKIMRAGGNAEYNNYLIISGLKSTPNTPNNYLIQPSTIAPTQNNKERANETATLALD